MKFVTFLNPMGEERAGWIEGTTVVDMEMASSKRLPSTMREFLQQSESYLSLIKELSYAPDSVYRMDEIKLKAPLPKPATFRDFVAFETHVKNAERHFTNAMTISWKP